MAEERVDQNTKQESQDALVETLADRVLLRVQQKLQSQEGRAHESGSVSGETSGNTSGGEPLQSKGPGGEGKSFVASPQLPEVLFRICKASQAELSRTGNCGSETGSRVGFATVLSWRGSCFG